jgi:hypothetical protein
MRRSHPGSEAIQKIIVSVKTPGQSLSVVTLLSTEHINTADSMISTKGVRNGKWYQDRLETGAVRQ